MNLKKYLTFPHLGYQRTYAVRSCQSNVQQNDENSRIFIIIICGGMQLKSVDNNSKEKKCCSIEMTTMTEEAGPSD